MNKQVQIKKLKQVGILQVVHYRPVKEEKNLSSPKLVATYHNNRSKSKYGPKPDCYNQGGVTVASLKKVDKNNPKRGTQVYSASSICSDNDTFCFKTGSELAIKRLYDMVFVAHDQEKYPV